MCVGRRGFLATVIGFGCLMLAVPGRAAGAGQLDAAFGDRGVVLTGLADEDSAEAIATQRDGKIVLAGTSSTNTFCCSLVDFGVARYNPDGSLDTTFAGDGTVTLDFGGQDGAHAVAIQPDGKVVVAGVTSAWPDGIAIARFEADGTLDTGFGGTGTVKTVAGPCASAFAIAIQRDGRILVTGRGGPSCDDLIVVRYEEDGSLDPTFGVAGVATVDRGGTEEGYALLVRPDGAIVAGGFFDDGVGRHDFLIVILSRDGVVRTTTTTDFDGAYDEIADLEIQRGRTVIAAGTSAGDFALARFDGRGRFDERFGTVTTDIGGWDSVEGAAVQRGRRIILVGATFFGDADIAIARYDRRGRLDRSFADDGISLTDVDTVLGGAGGSYDMMYAASLQRDGKLLVAGRVGTASGRFAMLRFRTR